MSDKPSPVPSIEEDEAIDVFVSYAHADWDVTMRLVETLTHRGVRCWPDKSSFIPPGERWAQQIRYAIARSRTFAVVVSAASLHSSWISKEWSAIQECAWRRENVSIFPITIGNVLVPQFLRQWHAIKLESPMASVEVIAEAISAHLSGGGASALEEPSNGSDRAMTVERFREIERALATSGYQEGYTASNE